MKAQQQEGVMAKDPVKSQGELDRERELANRKARAEAAKSQPYVIVHH